MAVFQYATQTGLHHRTLKNCHSGSFMVYTGISLSQMLNDIIRFDQLQWLLIDQTLHQLYDVHTELYFYRITTCFLGTFAMACQQGSVTLLYTLFHLFGDLQMLSLLIPFFGQTCHDFLGFFSPNSHRYFLDCAFYMPGDVGPSVCRFSPNLWSLMLDNS